ncbi:class I SAM-dependent methyltransferase [Prosthecochloris sp. CIB 2401]|uniref:class I SAM-dependent methyltransferase n=1 Tax=Prosthecochloris sp. CIB 2401 TaxID=1868325 RepID=UPI00080A9969|nr:class I SAM-dependent methyltransferase [Prosthecochloris sp. CIB 2401]ANT64864.1 Cypemycin methyltransferase [Prosthecochloris sp. CIB 2401]
MSTEHTAWFAAWFNHPLYLKLYSHRDASEARRCVETILKETSLAPSTPTPHILDVACGAGRHALEFSRRGFNVTANDLSPYLINCTRAHAEKEGLGITCTRQDMRTLDIDGSYELAVQLFSSFGYFDRNEDDAQVIQQVYRHLKPGGWYALDLINPAHLEKTLIPHSEKQVDELTVIEERSIANGRVKKEISITGPDGTHRFSESVRLFSSASIRTLLEQEGFEIVRILGDYGGTPFDSEHSPRMLLLSRKP